MEKKKTIIPAVLCGAVTAFLQFYLIPQFLMRGVPDVVWILLMLLLPVIPAVVLLRVPKATLWSLLTAWAIGLSFHSKIGGFLGYHLNSWKWDLFDYIAYLLFAFGWAIAAALVQFLVLLVLRRHGRTTKP